MLMPIENNICEWKYLCFFTQFDTCATALAYGLNWEKDLSKATLGQIKMAIFNINNYPNTKKPPAKAGYGSSQETIDFLTKWKGD